MHLTNGGLMNRLLFMLTGVLATVVILFTAWVSAADIPTDSENDSSKKDSWWQKRHDRPDIFYPHKIHFKAMEQEGDPCLLCHSFGANRVVKPDDIKLITTISNEPLEAICHDCHVDKQKAAFKCDLCHVDKTAIWPADHDFDYINQHAEDSRLDDGQCQTCHLDMSFCTDCHFKRDTTKYNKHQPGYLNAHGLDARINTQSCGRCHNVSYCSDCHRRAKP
jgi:hypothetical protein